ncbi:MAG: prolyl oligopeptidase family protein, partial [Pirellulales bacterium]
MRYFAVMLAVTFSITNVRAQPPEAPVRPVTDTYHGVDVVDPYRWLEKDADPEVKAWSDAENAFARSILDKLPNLEAIRAQVTKIMSAESPSYNEVTSEGGKFFSIKNQPPKQQMLLVVLDSLDDLATERVVLDPNELDPTGRTAMDWYVASPDGKLVAISLSVGGSEAGDVHVYDVATGKEKYEVVPHVNSGTAGGDVAWTPDSRGFYYTRHPWPNERPAEDRGFYQQVFYHQLGTSPADDRYEMGNDLPRIAEIQLDADKAGRVLASVQKGDGGEFAHYLRHPDGKWQQFTEFKDRIVHVLFGAHEDLFMVSLRDAPRGKIEHLKLADLGKSKPQVIIAEGQDAIQPSFFEMPTIVATPDRLYVTYQLGGPSEIRAFDYSGKSVEGPQATPIAAFFDLEPLEGNDLLFGSVSYVKPEGRYVFHAAKQETFETKLVSTSPVNLDDMEVKREFAISKDGTKVPVNIMFRKGTPLDGKNPCLATGYGGYGVSMTPAFSPNRRILLDQGFVIAVANIRGGGEYGEPWHLEGNLLKKQNVFDDFTAVLEHLIERKYTSSEHLAIVGGSNGGLLMGAVLVQHPALVKVVVSYVGMYDMLRSELSPNGEFNITEFGTVKDLDQFRAFQAYSPYEHVKQGVDYPAVLMLTGANDPRVEPMQSRKMIAKLQAATGSDVPILLRTSDSTGHGQGTPLADLINETVDAYAFIFDQLGIDFKT